MAGTWTPRRRLVLAGLCLASVLLAACTLPPRPLEVEANRVVPERNTAIHAELPLPELVMAGGAGLVERDAAAALPGPAATRVTPLVLKDGGLVLPQADDAQLPGGPYDALGDVLTELWIENPRVQQALAEVTAAGYEVAGARSGYYPYLRVDSRQASNGASATTVSLVQPLWDGGLTGARVDEQQAQRRLALVELNDTRLQLGLRATGAYFAAALAQEQAAIWAQYQQALRQLLGIIKRRAAKGVSAPVDMQTALARLRQADAGAAANQALLAVSRARLASLLERPLKPLVWPRAGSALTPAQVEQLAAVGLRPTHPAVAKAVLQVALASARADISRAKVWPQVSLQYSQLMQQSRGDATPDNALMLVLQYQSDGTLRGYRSSQAEQQRVLAASYGVDVTRRDVRQRLRSAQVRRQQAALQLAAQAAAANAYERLVESYLRQFKVGRKTWVEVLNVQRELNQTLLQVSAARQAYWVANTQLVLQGMAWQHISPLAPLPLMPAGDDS